MKKRNAYSLVECLATLAIIATVMTTVAVSMSGLHRACRHVQRDTASEMDLQRFAAQLRTDAHGALSAQQEVAEADDNTVGSMLLLLGEEESVRYTVTADRIQREHLQNEKVIHRESYRIPETCQARWKVKENGSAPMVSLQLDPDPADPNGPLGQQTIQVNAAIGLLKPSPAPIES
jgi:type II secretory pathway pseudopilin PulG